MNTAQTAEAYGLKPAKAKAKVQLLAQEILTLKEDPARKKKLTNFEATHQLPRLNRTPQAPYAREARYLLMNGGHHILLETAQTITNPSIWYALAGLN